MNSGLAGPSPRNLAVLFIAGTLLAGCSTEVRPVRTGPIITSSEQIPSEHRTAYTRYLTLCSGCHGNLARGTQTGPPLLHELYVPSHHSDRAFRRAIARGVEEHHWYFGNMPAVAGASADDAHGIIALLRWLQRAEGIGY